MRKFILYSHDGSENHGCEALVRTTAQLINSYNSEIILISTNPNEDHCYGIDKLCTIKKRGITAPISRLSWSFIKSYWHLKVHHNYEYMDYICKATAVGARRKDIALAIGGDSYCYWDSAKVLANEHMIWKTAGLKSVFWGCSLEPKLLENPQIVEDMKKFDLITARESISYEALKKINPNTILVSDSAFLLNKREIPLPEKFQNSDLVGINLSPLAENCEKISGITRKNYCVLIERILNDTDMKILLIPHVVWKNNDDRVVLKDLYDKYKTSGRILLIDDHNCEELKGFISRCRFFVGARTHATIAAYSSGVPTLVLGYSVKSRGIAKDLFGSYEHYVLPVQSLEDSDDLSKEFSWIMSHENDIKKRLTDILPEYTKRVYSGLNAVNKLR